MTVVYMLPENRDQPGEGMTFKIHRRTLVTLACACALLSGCGGNDGDEAVTLPNVTGLALSAAEQRLEGANVSWVFSEGEGPGTKTFETARSSSGDANSALAARHVATQDPRPGAKVTNGDVILLKLRPR